MIALQDIFTGVNGANLNAHTMDVGAGWTTFKGTWTIQGNAAQPPTNTQWAVATAQGNTADGTLTLSCVCPNTTSWALGFFARGSDINNGWLCVVERDAGGTPFIAIQRYVATTGTVVVQTNCTAATNTTVTLTAVLKGSTITLSANTGQSISTAAATFNQAITLHGITCFTASSYTVSTVDNFQFDVASAGSGSLLARRRRAAA